MTYFKTLKYHYTYLERKLYEEQEEKEVLVVFWDTEILYL